MRKWIGAILASLLLATAIPSFAQQGKAFADLPAGHWAYDAVTTLANNGILEGYAGPGNTSVFVGQRTMTRYEVAQALARLIDYVKANPSNPTAAQIRQVIQGDQALQDLLRGPKGDKGDKGDTGATGAAGGQGIQGQKGDKGDVGPKGDKGDTGPQGPVGVTPAELATIRQLLSEFRGDIDLLKGNVAALDRRVTALESNANSPLHVGIAGGMRWGLYGTELNSETNGLTSDDNTSIFNNSADQTLRKDTLKGTRFGVYLFDMNLDGRVSNNVMAHATMRVTTPIAFPPTTTPSVFDGPNTYFPITTPGGVSLPTYADSVQMWDWYATFTTAMFGRSMQFTGGRQSARVNERTGLLIDNSRQPNVGVAFDSSGRLSFGGYGGFIDRATGSAANPSPAVAQDAFAYGYLGWDAGSFNVNGAYLQSGFGQQRGWSVAANANLFGANVFGEYARLIRDIDGAKPTTGNRGWVVGADVLNNWKGLSLTGMYGELFAGYTPYLSNLYPYSAVSAYDINWVDRPLFLDPNNVGHGWEGRLNYAISKTWSLQARYYDGNRAKSPNPSIGAADADAVWTASLKKVLSSNVSATVLYGRRELNEPFAATLNRNDSLQVLRGTLEVAF